MDVGSVDVAIAVEVGIVGEDTGGDTVVVAVATTRTTKDQERERESERDRESERAGKRDRPHHNFRR